MKTDTSAAGRYFESMNRALDALDVFLREEGSPLYRHDLIGAVVEQYLARLRGSFDSWRNRIAFGGSFRISQAESGFPAFQNVLELENDRAEADRRLAAMPREEQIRQEMVDFILAKKSFPEALQKTMAERTYLQSVREGRQFAPLVLPETVRVSVNPKTGRPYYIVHWGCYDGTAHLPLVYIASLEDSSPNMGEAMLDRDGKMKRDLAIPLPVEGLLNPELAHRFDDFCDKNSSYALTLSTIATNLDKDFETLHPKQLRRFVLGPFYHADITVHGATVDRILQQVRKPENRWLLMWTMQEIHSVRERAAKWGLMGGEPVRDEFHINTDDLDCVRMGVSAHQRHALVPHEAYQAIYAAGETQKIFGGYEVHIFTGTRVLRSV